MTRSIHRCFMPRAGMHTLSVGSCAVAAPHYSANLYGLLLVARASIVLRGLGALLQKLFTASSPPCNAAGPS